MANMWKRNTFTSYVATPPGDMILNVDGVAADTDEWRLKSDDHDVFLAKPRLLPNELVVASAPAHLLPELDATKEAIFGLLSVTNFKLAFVPLQRPTANASLQQLQLQESYQDHLYLQRNDVTLNNIDHIYQLSDSSARSGGSVASASRNRLSNAISNATSSSSKRKRIEAQQKIVSGRIAALHIVCKNFRLLKFAFEQRQSKAARDYGKVIASALARFAFPSRHDLSFAYCFREPYYSTLLKGGGAVSGVTMFNSKNDWTRELIRCGAQAWQVVSADSLQQQQREPSSATDTLPPHFVIPQCCSVERFLELSRAFCCSRAAFWVFGYGNASLVRLAELRSAAAAQQETNKLENVMLELVRKCNERLKMKLLQLNDLLPSVADVQRAYLKFRRLCTPEGPQQFLVHDAKYLTLLERSNWLFYVSLCLRYSCEAADWLRSGTSCVLQESNGRDLCCVISSLAQIMLDPLYRTIEGFQSLVQKEWVALEHPFQTRLGHVRGIAAEAPDEEDGESPIFLLFLDCVWQLLQQYPEEFEYSQTYLTTLWDACFFPICDTFQFDSEADRARAVREAGLVLRPVWDWSEQFAEKDKVFFNNPFYQRRLGQEQQQAVAVRRSVAIPSNAVMLPGLAQQTPAQRFKLNPQLFAAQSSVPKDRYLQPQHLMSELAIWEQCYYRWLPVLEIKHGGFAQVDLYHRLLLSNIAKLQRCLELQEFDDLPDIYYELTGEARPSPPDPAALAAKRNSIEMIDGVERRRKSLPSTVTSSTNGVNGSTAPGLLPTISSFFPFSVNAGESQQLLDILTQSNEFLLEGGSIMERLSIA